MLRDIEAVLFDLDGTLIDSMWLWKEIDIEYLGRHGKELPADLQKSIEGMSFTETALYFKERFDIEDDVATIKNDWNEMASRYYLEKVTLKDGVRELLSHLKDLGVKMGIATSNSPELAGGIVKRFGLGDYMTTIRTSCQVANGKPAPDVYLKAAEDLGVEPSKCLVFEDVENGVKAGKNANMKVCAVYDEFSKDERSELEAIADYYIVDYKAVMA